jgi:hypothetical protein
LLGLGGFFSLLILYTVGRTDVHLIMVMQTLLLVLIIIIMIIIIIIKIITAN